MSSRNLSTQILISGPIVALGETVHFPPGILFSTFRFQVMAVLVKKTKWPTRQKVFPLPTGLWEHCQFNSIQVEALNFVEKCVLASRHL